MALADGWPRWNRDRQGALLHAVCATYPGAVAEGNCVESARIGRDLLRRLGVVAKPAPGYVRVYNDLCVRTFDEGRTLDDEPKAWAIGVEPLPSGGAAPVYGRGAGVASFPGHMVLTVDGDPGWVVDLSATQFNRPAVGLHMGPLYVPRDLLSAPPGWFGLRAHLDVSAQPVAHRFPDGSMIVWTLNPDDRQLSGWKTSNAWRHDVDRHDLDAWAAAAADAFEKLDPG